MFCLHVIFLSVYIFLPYSKDLLKLSVWTYRSGMWFLCRFCLHLLNTGTSVVVHIDLYFILFHTVPPCFLNLSFVMLRYYIVTPYHRLYWTTYCFLYVSSFLVSLIFDIIDYISLLFVPMRYRHSWYLLYLIQCSCIDNFLRNYVALIK